MVLIIAIACSNSKSNKTISTSKEESEISSKLIVPINDDFKKYWYQGTAEITSYSLEQARYGELRNGQAVLIFVTEDFLAKEQVKADYRNTDNIPILKLNSTKKFNTGIYPYSIMQSTFYPIHDNSHAIKVSSSMQEWCGHVYAQLNNREQFEVLSHSYFQGEADQEFLLPKAHLENEIWTKIRINPDKLPLGTIKMIPSFEYSRLKHKEMKAYTAEASLVKEGNIQTYTINYPALKRTLKIDFTLKFPYEIEGWSETFTSGFGAGAKTLTTKATKLRRIKSAYWNKNSNKDEVLRDSLGLK